MRLSSRNLFIYSLQILAARSLVSKVAAFAEDQDPLPFNDNQTKGTQVGDVYEVNISSTYDESDIKPITSEDGKSNTYTLTNTNASYISVHFRQFDLPSSCSLVITDDNEEEEQQPYTLTGQGKFGLGTFWAHHVNGDTMKLSLSCDDEEDKEFALFEIDQFAAGFPLNNNPEVHPYERHLRSRTKERRVEEEKMPSFLKAIDEERNLSICGKDDKRNAVCYKKSEPAIYNKAKAVARLLINGRFACTGWLVSKGSLLFTNEHCIDSLSDVQNTDFEFMGEESNCAIGSSDGSWFSSRNHAGIYDGTALLKVSATWDYALIQLSGNPVSKYGFLELDNRKAGVNEQIYIPQHPGGRPKEIGVFDSNHNGNCRVKGYRRGCAPEDMTYSCDTEGGSSGSPVLSRTNNKVIALHHCGGGCNGNLGAPIYKFYNEIQGFINVNTVPIAQVDFSDAASPSNTPFALKNGAQILPTAPGGFPALRINKDGPYALIPGVNINPSSMPYCTLTIGLYLESIANNRGWVFGNEQTGYDRTILMHDSRFGGGIASAVGKTWQPWNKPQPPPLKEWIHVTAVFRQNGESVVYLNGVRSDRSVIATNNNGRGDLAIGRPEPHSNHWVDSWIKEVHVFDNALDDEAVEKLADDFFKKIF